MLNTEGRSSAAGGVLPCTLGFVLYFLKCSGLLYLTVLIQLNPFHELILIM